MFEKKNATHNFGRKYNKLLFTELRYTKVFTFTFIRMAHSKIRFTCFSSDAEQTNPKDPFPMAFSPLYRESTRKVLFMIEYDDSVPPPPVPPAVAATGAVELPLLLKSCSSSAPAAAAAADAAAAGFSRLLLSRVTIRKRGGSCSSTRVDLGVIVAFGRGKVLCVVDEERGKRRQRHQYEQNKKTVRTYHHLRRRVYHS